MSVSTVSTLPQALQSRAGLLSQTSSCFFLPMLTLCVLAAHSARARETGTGRAQCEQTDQEVAREIQEVFRER